MRCWCLTWLLFFFFGLNQAAKREPDGKMYEHVARGIRPWYPANDVKSIDYPSPAPHDVEQTWRFVAASEDDKPKAMKLICYEINIPKKGNSCGENVLRLEHGRHKQEWCGEVQPFAMTTTTTDITLSFFSGKGEGGRVHCTVEAIYIDENRNEVTTTTTGPPPPMNKYRFLESVEIDSSEHGGEEGDKSTSCPCGWANKVSSRIVNGVETARNEFPFAAGLVERGTKWPFCGATIITEYHAITAAHCTEGSFKYNLSLAIIVGAHNFNDDIKPPAEVIDVDKIIQHQEYIGSPYLKNDLSLLVLKNKIKFGPFVGPACLPTHNVNLDRQYIKVIGWGDLYFRGPGSEFLRKINVRVVPMDECNSEYRDLDTKRPKQICTFSKNKASCQGDSGGPVIWLDPDTNRYTLVGAVSFGSACGSRPTVHTAIGAYLDWIQHYVKATRGSQVCKKIQ